MDKGQNNDNMQLSDIHLAKSLYVKRHNIYIRNLKKWKVNSPILRHPLQNFKYTVSEVFVIQDSHIQHIYNYVYNFHTQEVDN